MITNRNLDLQQGKKNLKIVNGWVNMKDYFKSFKNNYLKIILKYYQHIIGS